MVQLRFSAAGSIVLCSALLLCAPGCLIDDDEPCGDNQVSTDAGYCACDDGYVLDPNRRCVACGEHERVVDGACECEPGFTRGADLSCEPMAELPTGLGDACDADADCDGDYGHCRPVQGGSGYCTSQGCSDDDDCDGDYACNLAAAEPFCMRAPTGLGDACSSSDDCAGNDAAYCETFMSNACLVSGCSLEPDDCFTGWHCCDFSAVSLDNLCLPEEAACPF